MKVKNVQADALPTNLTTVEFGKAMSQLDLSSVPKQRRPKAVMDHMMKIMADSLIDKRKAEEIHISRILHNRKH